MQAFMGTTFVFMPYVEVLGNLVEIFIPVWVRRDPDTYNSLGAIYVADGACVVARGYQIDYPLLIWQLQCMSPDIFSIAPAHAAAIANYATTTATNQASTGINPANWRIQVIVYITKVSIVRVGIHKSALDAVVESSRNFRI